MYIGNYAADEGKKNGVVLVIVFDTWITTSFSFFPLV